MRRGAPLVRRQSPIDQPAARGDPGVEHERRSEQGRRIRLQRTRQPVGNDGRSVRGAAQRPDETVAGEQGGPLASADGFAESRLLQRQEDADVAGRRIERTDEGDQQKKGEAIGEREPAAGRDHQRAGCQEEGAQAGARATKANRQRQYGRTEQRRRAEHADLQSTQAEGKQVGRKDDADAAIDNGTQPASGKDEGCGGRC